MWAYYNQIKTHSTEDSVGLKADYRKWLLKQRECQRNWLLLEHLGLLLHYYASSKYPTYPVTPKIALGFYYRPKEEKRKTKDKCKTDASLKQQKGEDKTSPFIISQEIRSTVTTVLPTQQFNDSAHTLYLAVTPAVYINNSSVLRITSPSQALSGNTIAGLRYQRSLSALNCFSPQPVILSITVLLLSTRPFLTA